MNLYFRRVALASLCALSLLSSTLAFANYFCSGVVDTVVVNPSGLVMINSSAAGLANVELCQIGATANGVGPDACNAVLASVITARTTGQSVTWAFDDGLTCSTHPQWAWLTGWYFGPQF